MRLTVLLSDRTPSAWGAAGLSRAMRATLKRRMRERAANWSRLLRARRTAADAAVARAKLDAKRQQQTFSNALGVGVDAAAAMVDFDPVREATARLVEARRAVRAQVSTSPEQFERWYVRNAVTIARQSDVDEVLGHMFVKFLSPPKGGDAAAAFRNVVITGAAGSGKTFFARLLGEFLRYLGDLPRATLRETTAADFVAGYVGQTAGKTRAAMDGAFGGVLFIDEAYAVTETARFGQEMVAEMLVRLDHDRGRHTVVLAGYADRMRAFFRSNEGLNRRFPHRIHLSPPTARFVRELALRGLAVPPDTRDALTRVIDAKSVPTPARALQVHERLRTALLNADLTGAVLTPARATAIVRSTGAKNSRA
jgi:hypothetical protein